MTVEYRLREMLPLGDVIYDAGTPVERMTMEHGSGFLEAVLEHNAITPSDAVAPMPGFHGYAVVLPGGHPALLTMETLEPRPVALRVIR